MEPWSYAVAGRFDEHTFESDVLKDNRLGDPHVRPLWVYVPPGYDDEPAAAVFSTGDGLDHYRRLLSGAGDHLAEGGGVILQFDGQVLEAERSELPWLRTRLESLVAAAA